MNERVLVGHLRGMCENVCQVGQLCRSPGVEGETLKKKKKKKVSSVRLTYEG